jgi:hypothetical protein
MGLITKSNYREIPAFYEYVLNDLGADKLKLNFIQPSFGQSGKIDPFFAEETDVDADELQSIIDECDKKYGLGFNPAWRDDVYMYFKSLHGIKDLERGWSSKSGTQKHICNSYERNIMVNQYGEARLCFSTAFKGKQIEKPGDLRRFWATANGTRRKMNKCNQFCGISHSVRANSSTLAGLAKAADFAKASQDQKRSKPISGVWHKLRGAF